MLFNFYKCNQFNISLHALRITYTLIYILQYNLSDTYNKFTVHYLQLRVKRSSYIDMPFLYTLFTLFIIIYCYLYNNPSYPRILIGSRP